RAEKNTEGHRILDFQTKKNDAEEVLSVTDQKIHRALSDLGQSVFRVLGGTSFGRIDVRMCAAGIPHFMEANLMPGLKKGYFFRSCALNLGMSYEQMIIGLAENRIKPKTSHSGVRNK
ncbi:MAG: D-alanine--D-alanine ligase, partial [Proteobacteria bacterium]|nr:D-alanine--D-alanine ligase [Pseudomonadota bacterium]